jgi:hypothetical protein
MESSVSPTAAISPTPLWDSYRMALDRVTERMERIVKALDDAGVTYAIVGGQAVALWVATCDPAAVRTTKDVNLLVARIDLPKVRSAANAAGFDYFEALGVGMLLDRGDPNPRHAVHLVWADERVRSTDGHPTPRVGHLQVLGDRYRVVSLADLVLMKLSANRDQDRVHLRDMIDVGLVDREIFKQMPADLQPLLDQLLSEAGR